MKTFLLLFSLVISSSFFAQENNIQVSPEGIFDKVFTMYGDEVQLKDLAIGNPYKSQTAPAGAVLIPCNSGYFDLYFEIGSGMEGNSVPEQNRRAVICKVFEDLSNFIVTPNPSVKVNILIRNINSIPSLPSGVAGVASAYYVAPGGLTNLGGIIDNEIWKTINAGVDSYTNVVSPLSYDPASGGFYHGYVAFDFSMLWHTTLSQSTPAGFLDMYTIALHEVTHALGFGSLINSTGASKLSGFGPYYSRYDLFLKTQANQPLITNTGACSMYNYSFNPSLTPSIMVSSPFNCATHINFAGSVNQAVHTAGPFTNGSSLSHLEEICRTPSATSNQYYVMSEINNPGPSYMKRFLKPEERQVFCDIGYKVNTTYGVSSNFSFINYGGSQCSGNGVVGINDGINSNGSFQYVVTAGSSISIANLSNNDVGSTHFECLTDMYGNGSPSLVAGPNGSNVMYNSNSNTPGLAVLRYVPYNSLTGKRGNITYIYVFIKSANCTPSACSYLNNGNFENAIGCGSSTTPIQVNCWTKFSNSPDIFRRNCTAGLFGVPTPMSSPAADTWNGIPNNTFYGLVSTGGSGTPHWNESVQTLLNNPLVQGSTYTISLRANMATDYSASFLAFGPALPPSGSGQITFAGSSSLLAPLSGPATSLPTALTSFPSATNATSVTVPFNVGWQYLTHTFTYNGTNNINNLLIMNTSNMNSLTNQPYTYIFIDEVDIVEVSPATTLTLPNVVCINQTLSNLSFYAPVPGGVFSGTGVSSSGGVYSFNATTAGIGTHVITYVYTNAIGCVITINQQVQVVNTTLTATATASTTSACLGQTITLTGTSPGANSFSWNPGNLSGSTVNTVFNGAPLYTLTASNAAGCVATAQVTVNVAPSISVSISPNVSTICPGQQVALTATGATNYTWTGPNVTPSTGATVTASPTSTATYTVVGTNANGCTASNTASVSVVPCTDCSTGNLLSGTITSLSTTNGTVYRIANNITISGTVNLNGNNVKITPNVTITVTSTGTLNINGSHLYGCETMWKGIVVQPGGKVNIQPLIVSNVVIRTALIEDALIAIDFSPITTQQSVAVLTVNNATFNKNQVGIKVQGYAFANASAIFSIKNSLFTSRRIYTTGSSTWALTTAIKAANNNSNLFLEPYIAASYLLSNLKSPMSSVFADKGLWLINMGTTSPAAPYTYNSLIIGSAVAAEYNVFDYHKMGILAQNTNLQVINTNFQFPRVIDNSINSPGTGYGIYANKISSGEYQVDVAGTTAQPNRFYGMYRALYVYQYRNVQFAYNTIRSNRPITTPAAGYFNGGYGVDMYLSNYDQVYVGYNTIYNIRTGVHLNCTVFGNSPTIQMVNNTFHRTLNTTTGGYADDAILVENVYPNISGLLWINNNNIAGGYRGITVKNWSKTTTQANSNTIVLSGNTSQGFQFAGPSHGIAFDNCTHSSAQIANNTITGYNTATPNFKGIALTASSGNVMNCNSVSNTYSGLYFNGNCNPTRTTNNSMQNHRYGFVLDNNGIIGQQGTPATTTTPSAPADNRWLGTNWASTNPGNVGNFKHACLNGSFTQNSPMHVRSTAVGSIYSPNGSIANFPSNYPYTVSASPTVTLILVSNPPLLASCTVVANPGGSGLTTNDLVMAMEESTEGDAVSINQTYRALDADTSLMDNSAVLTEFYEDYDSSNIAMLLEVEKALAVDSNAQAATTNGGILSENSLEASYQMYYEALRHFEENSFTEADSLILMNLVYGCPTLQGPSVTQAATLYNAVYQTAEVYENICPECLDKSQKYIEEVTSNTTPYRIYPIPNNGSFYLNGKMMFNYSIRILNNTGSLVFEREIEDEISQEFIQTNLTSGSYIVILSDDLGIELYREKIVIIH
jgi:hypothetical protein